MVNLPTMSNPVGNSHFTDRGLEARTNSAAREAASYGTILPQLTRDGAKRGFCGSTSSTVWL